MSRLECRPGPPTVLTATYCMKMADMGFGLSRDDVMHTAFEITEKKPFFCWISWTCFFRGRHARAACTNEEIIVDFFGKLGSIYVGLNIPMMIYIMDEMGRVGQIKQHCVCRSIQHNSLKSHYYTWEPRSSYNHGCHARSCMATISNPGKHYVRFS